MTGFRRRGLPSITVMILVSLSLSGCSAFMAIGNVTKLMVKNELYPPAYVDLPFQAGVKGTVLETQFRVLTAESYTFYLDLCFQETDKPGQAYVRGLTGTGAYDRAGPGARQIDTGLPIPVHLSVGRVGDAGGAWSILNGVFTNHDFEGCAAAYCGKVIGGARLDPGVYRVRVEALQDVPELNRVPVQFDMHARHFLR